jgi:acetylornithine/succinyldiaminopimelate/putrescine aminotransferase
VLFLADEIQSGLGRCGTTFACEREDVVPDVYMLGKALGGAIVVAITFFMLAVYISWEAVKSLIGHEEPLTSPVGLILAVLG